MSRLDNRADETVISKFDTQGDGTTVGGVLGFLSMMLNDLVLDLETSPSCLGVESLDVSWAAADETTLLTALFGRCCVQLVRRLAAELDREEAAEGTRVEANDKSASLPPPGASKLRTPFLRPVDGAAQQVPSACDALEGLGSLTTGVGNDVWLLLTLRRGKSSFRVLELSYLEFRTPLALADLLIVADICGRAACFFRTRYCCHCRWLQDVRSFRKSGAEARPSGFDAQQDLLVMEVAPSGTASPALAETRQAPLQQTRSIPRRVVPAHSPSWA